MKRVLSTLIILAMALIALGNKYRIEFEFKGPDGNKLQYHIINESSLLAEVIWRSERYGKPYTYEHIVIPEHVTYKGKEYTVVGIDDAFYNCRTLKTITIPPTIKYMQDKSFEYCYELEKIFISDLDAWCKMKMGNYSPITGKAQLLLNNELVTHVIFPNSMEIINSHIFDGYDYLESVVIPSSVKSIDNYAFHSCIKLKLVKIYGENLRRIGQGAFSNCDALTELQLPNSVIDIKDDAFRSCNKLRKINWPLMTKTISKGTFNDCAFLNFEIPASVVSIERGAFTGCNTLREVIIHNPSIKIGDYAFGGCKSLVSIKGLSEESSVSANAFLYEYEKWGRQYNKPPFSFEQYKKTFSYFATGKVEEAIAQWQKKGEFETNEQWKQRVNEANRDVEVKNQIEKIRQAYINKMTVLAPTPVIQTYDAEREIFPIKIGTETMYVKVPVIEAQQFKQNFKSDYIHTEYNIVNDLPAVVGRTCKVGDKVYATTNTYAKADDINTLALNLPPLEIDFGGSSTATAASQPKTPTDRTIDQDIPSSEITNANSFAVIIGNENYTMVPKVDYAKNDAQVFAEYCRKTLGLPAKNVRSYGDATYAMMMSAIKDIQEIAKAYNGNINVIFYYAGHGIPNESNRDSYLLPIDADGRQTDFCYPVSKLYQELGAMNAKKVVVFMDACFSGALRGNGMLMSARTVAIKPKTNAPTGNMIVMTAASGDETAFPYIEKGHGMFTYYLLKKLRDTKGNCTLGELGDYIKTNVQQESIVVNRKSQTPTLNFSPAIINSWKTYKLR